MQLACEEKFNFWGTHIEIELNPTMEFEKDVQPVVLCATPEYVTLAFLMDVKATNENKITFNSKISSVAFKLLKKEPIPRTYSAESRIAGKIGMYIFDKDDLKACMKSSPDQIDTSLVLFTLRVVLNTNSSLIINRYV